MSVCCAVQEEGVIQQWMNLTAQEDPTCQPFRCTSFALEAGESFWAMSGQAMQCTGQSRNCNEFFGSGEQSVTLFLYVYMKYCSGPRFSKS